MDLDKGSIELTIGIALVMEGRTRGTGNKPGASVDCPSTSSSSVMDCIMAKSTFRCKILAEISLSAPNT